MDENIQSQLNRAKSLFQDLEKSCNNDLRNKKISEETKNLCPEVLLKIRRLLDQAIYKYYKIHYFPKLSEVDKKSAKVYFPIVSKKESLKSILGMAKMGNLETNNSVLYNYLESIQPYNKEYSWLNNLRDFSNEAHIQLTPQTIKHENETRLGSAVVVTGKGVSMNNCFIQGIPVNSKDINTEPLENFDPRLNVQRITWVSFLFSGTDINILYLCKKSIEDGEKIIKKVLEFV